MNLLNRRGFFKTANHAAAMAVLPGAALAFATPQQNTPSDDLPDWWKNLVSEVQGLRDDLGQSYGDYECYAVKAERLAAIFRAMEDATF